MTDSGSTSDSTGDDTVDRDDVKRKFREALEKKQHRHHATAEGADHDGSDKSHGTDKPIEVKEFRRKSV